MPVVRVSIAVMRAISRSRSGLRVAPRPMLCGNRVAPTMLLWPCIASMPQITGIALPPPLVSIDASQNASASASHSSGFALYLPPGSEPPPARIEPSRYLRTSSGVTLAMSPCTIWPTFSSTVIVASRSSTFFSSAGSSANGHCGCGQLAGSIAPASEPAAATVSSGCAVAALASPLRSPQPASSSAAARLAHSRETASEVRGVLMKDVPWGFRTGRIRTGCRPFAAPDAAPRHDSVVRSRTIPAPRPRCLLHSTSGASRGRE